MMETPVKPRLMAALSLVFVGFATACAHVGQEEFDTEIAALRSALDLEDPSVAVSNRNAAQIAALSARLDRLGGALADLEDDFDVTVQRLETAIRFNVPVYFDFDQDNLRPEDLPVLARFGDVVTAYYPNVLLTVEGFTDRAGSPEYNIDLGKRRAEAVRLYLIETAGFTSDRVRAVSYGEAPERLVFPDQAGHDQGIENRRVALVVEHLPTADSRMFLSRSR